MEGEREGPQCPQTRSDEKAWAAFHEGQAERHRRTLEDLIAHHEEQAAKLCEEDSP